ncbi:hypothetical protein GCM10009850_060580 [Nonomuraea monospora]|uniref:Excreted virulence factor EspC (Type VII ESX diderm) n=1 Tax=Nonomuraea monospora TaxID=568818 RepID=A0ABN3CNB3_9ACTN
MATDTGGAQYAGGSSLSGATIQFKDGRIKQVGEGLGEQAPNMDAIAQNVGGIRVEPPAFGVIGIGLNYAHDQLKDNAHNTLKTARDVLSDYRTALTKLEANYQKADDDNDGVIQTDPYGLDGGGGGGGIDPSSLGGGIPDTGGIPGAGDLGAGDLGAGDLPSSELPDSELPDSQLPDSELPDTDLPDSNVPDTDLPDTQVPEVPDTQVPDTNIPEANIPDANASLPTTPSIEDQLNHNVPDPSTTLPTDPTKTGLAGYDPTKLGATPTTPTIPGTTTSLGPGLSTGSPTGVSSGGMQQPAAAGAAAARGLNGMNGMGMPFMPPMGGGGGDQNSERDKPDYVRGDEADWVDDIDIAPPVIGEA